MAASRARLLALLCAPCAARLIVPLPEQIRHGAVNPNPGASVNDVSLCDGDLCYPPPIRPGLARFCQSLSSLQEESGAAFGAAGSLLQRYCSNAASSDDPKFRRIKKSNRAFSRDLAPYRSGVDCLCAVGFAEEQTGEDDGHLVLKGAADKALLEEAVVAVDRLLLRLQLQAKWPVDLLSEFNRTCSGLEFKRDLLDELAAELAQPHIPALLRHNENLERVRAQLALGTEGAKQVCAQLQAVRANSSTVTPQPPTGASRVVAVTNLEQWYDMLMDTKGLLVAFFGAQWCGACKQMEPYFESLSTREQYRGITFVHVDADETPALVGDNQVNAFPTIKFFKNAAEERLPMEGADAVELERILNGYVTHP